MHRRTLLRNALALAPVGVMALTRDLWACDDEPVCAPTGEDIEGPYYLPGAPRRSVLLEPGMEGTAFALSGVLRDTRCGILRNTRIEFWQCDARGRYDTRGMRLRGALETDSGGRYEVRTIVPGRYLNGDRYRPAHIHVKVHRGAGVFTTQLYFAGDPYNAGDPWFRPDRALRLARATDGLASRFDLVVRAGA